MARSDARHAWRYAAPLAQWFETFGRSLWLLGARHADDAAQARLIRRLLRLRSGHRVLDAPCGRGRIAVHLAKAGCAVTGIDLQAPYIRSARSRVRRAGLAAEFCMADLRTIDFPGEFHGVVNWFSSFGYFDDATNRDVLRRLARALRPGGRLLVEGMHRECVLRSFRRQRQSPGLAIRNRWDPATQRIEGRWTVQAGAERGVHRSSIRVYTPGQLRRLFVQAGLEVTGLFDENGAQFTRRARRLIVVGRRPR